MARIDELNGVDPRQATRLRKSGVRTTEALLRRAATKPGRESLAKTAGLESSLLWTLVNRADLMRVKGIGSEYAELLEACGVDTIRELRRRNPKTLISRMFELNDQHRRVRRLPTESMVVSWIEGARAMEPLARA
jgi:predicted RecB family nuclease